MRWVCILVTSNVPKREKKRNQLGFLPNVKCNIEKLSHIGVALGNFLVFFSHFHLLFGYQYVGSQNARKN